MQEWYVIYTKPNKEPLVNRQLEEKDLEVFFPVLQFDRGYRRGLGIEPFFPHYLFVKVDLSAPNANNIRWLPGVRTIVEVDGRPAVVPEPIIEGLRQRLDPMSRRVMRKSEWLFQPGQKVSITAGPFKGFAAVFQKGLSGEQRVQVLLEFLGSSIRTNVNVEHLTASS
jgi:transcriptional antiterminator RfaH